MVIDTTLVRPGIAPPIISTTPNSPTVWAKPSTAPVSRPGLRQRQRNGEERARQRSAQGRGDLQRPVADRGEGVADRLDDERQRIDDRADQQTGEREREGPRAPGGAIAPPGPSGPRATSR